MGELSKTQECLNAALGIRHRIRGFRQLAAALNHVSLNAQIASARIGAESKAFSVFTSETLVIAVSLGETVERIRALTRQWTCMIAKTLLDESRLSMLRRARAKSGDKNQESLVQAEGVFFRSLQEFERTNAHFISDLIQIIEDMGKSLRLINYVKSGLMIETSRLQGDKWGTASFRHLALEMQNAADNIRKVATEVVSQLHTLSYREIAHAV